VQLGQKGFASIRRGVSPTDPACTLYKAQVTVEVVQ
jgi:hypothetical protein